MQALCPDDENKKLIEAASDGNAALLEPLLCANADVDARDGVRRVLYVCVSVCVCVCARTCACVSVYKK